MVRTKVPVCFFIENNHYAVSTTPEEATGEPRLSARGLGFAIPSWRVDGMDPVAVYLAMEQALALMRAGGGPTLIEADVYRYFHQNGPFPGSAFGYRTKDEEQGWRERDPLIRVAAHLVRRGVLREDDVAQLWSRSKQVMSEVDRTMQTFEKLRRLLAGESLYGGGVALRDFTHTVPASMVALQDLRLVEPMMRRLIERSANPPGQAPPPTTGTGGLTTAAARGVGLTMGFLAAGGLLLGLICFAG